MQVPITKFNPTWTGLELEYAAWTFYQDAVVYMVGCLSNTAVFGLLTTISWVSRTVYGKFPKYFYKVIAWVGVFAVIDPLIVFFWDTVLGNWENGDMYKFSYYFSKSGDNAIVGAYLSFFGLLAFTIFTGYIVYNYMVFRYMNGRILDLYRRLSGQYKAFFTPLDNEVSLKYLQWVVSRAKKQDMIIVSESKDIKDKFGLP